MRIKKAIIAAAGFGTRLLPATKVIPKEMLSVIDRPIIQYLVEEAVESGIKEIAIITRPEVSLIKEHFLAKPVLETHLKKQGKERPLKGVKRIEKMARFHFLRQDPNLPYGTGAPLVTARHLIGKRESFVYMFGDDVFLAKVPATKQLLKKWEKNKEAVIMSVQ